MVLTADIDRYQDAGATQQPRQGIWRMYKQLRQYPLSNDQILLLVLRFALNMSVRQIKEHMGWTSTATLYRRYNNAIKILKDHNYEG